jgi:nicotinamidase-related amidase
MKHDCILFVDFQRDFLEAEGRLSIGQKRSEAILSQANRLLEAARTGKLSALFVASEFSSNDWLGNLFRRHSALRGSSGAEIDPRIFSDGFPVFTKATSDAFSNPDLLAYLRRDEFTRIVITGVMAEGCVRATACSAVKHGFKVAVITDAVESKADWMRRLGLWMMREKDASFMNCEQYLIELANKEPYETMA